METWKPVVGYEGLYEVSDLGNVKSLRRNRIMRPGFNSGGYLQVILRKDGGRARMIHRLVAQHFLADFRDGLEVNHKNGIKPENQLMNLEMVTRSQNLIHRHKVLGQKTYRAEGTKNYRARFSEPEVIEIRALKESGLGYGAIAKKFSSSISAICHIVKRRSWVHI